MRRSRATCVPDPRAEPRLPDDARRWLDERRAPLKVDTKETWLAYVGKQPSPYVYRRLDSIQVELHGDIALTSADTGICRAPTPRLPQRAHLYVCSSART